MGNGSNVKKGWNFGGGRKLCGKHMGSENAYEYSAFHPLSRKVLKMSIWEVTVATYCPTAQAGKEELPEFSSSKPCNRVDEKRCTNSTIKGRLKIFKCFSHAKHLECRILSNIGNLGALREGASI